MLFKPFKLQLPKFFRRGEPVSPHIDPAQERCVCGHFASDHSTARVSPAPKQYDPAAKRVTVNWRGCRGMDPIFGDMTQRCLCPGFWKKS